MIKKSILLAAVATVGLTGVAEARDQIRIVGSSTVYPFTTVVAETFGKKTGMPTPVVESTGSGGGFKLFCAGLGVEHPDFSNASRAIKKSEIETCAKNGVTAITEMKVGYDGIVLANAKSAPAFTLTKEQIYLALAKDVPVDGAWVANPNKNWSDIDSSLPDEPIEVLGPPPTSGTRDAFLELVMEPGCEELAECQGLSKDEFKARAFTMREDGGFIEAGENDNLIVQKLEANPAALGIFGFSYLDQNHDKIQGAVVEGEAPTFENIASGAYPVSRPLFVYVKTAHMGVIPGMEEFLAEYTSDAAWGPEGYLADKGLIPMPDEERAKYREAAMNKVDNVNM
ncbi:PstS family phosphate ABC transporter substrate-binding protein [Roseospira marina]|uniref:PstS family phosphate ABC transporter substrate-binding protein n=1 Tax=Roseospira marina TaxID=140057 RepID=A0A5M6IDZ4_9PROT|nr:PstS family phosphate ABC transporter substrate-binding protein [Roseospira marina]KAA5606496.1 PstS family phosphate ABC transporter substrate-binding protein [Roseospira marina]MBB4314082.1 phosphate transport system substrate-binding protein [Roseospira marina]MBB5087243.1 phosphate transport system substrate-binding protein [Roseospira marina]